MPLDEYILWWSVESSAVGGNTIIELVWLGLAFAFWRAGEPRVGRAQSRTGVSQALNRITGVSTLAS